jgi:heme exporter protein D
MTGGIVYGGWEFVWAAYGLTGTALLIYGVSLIARLRRAKNNAHD